MYVEGIPITNAVVQGEGRNLSFGISVDAVDQFQVETSGTAVMFNGQGASNYVVKSGTNTFHGSGVRVLPQQGARREGVLLRLSSRTTTSTNTAARSAVRSARTRCSSSCAYDGYRDRRQTPSALTSIPTLARAQRRLQRAAGDDLRSANDAARIRTAPASCAIRFRATSSRSDRISSDLAILPVVPAGSRPTAACRTTISAASLPTGFNNENVTGEGGPAS